MTVFDLKTRFAHKVVRINDLKKISRQAGINSTGFKTKAAMIELLTREENVPKILPLVYLLPPILPDPILLLAEAEKAKVEAAIQAAVAEAAKAEAAKLQTLRDALDNSTKVNRTLSLTFVALMFYILLIVASTTDLQLFLPDSKVRLPIIDVELPLLDFYTVVPFIILVFHFHLLINLKHHQEKYRLWREEMGSAAKNTQLDPILLNFLESYKPWNLFRILLVLVISASVFYFPLIDIILMQWSFGAYHSFEISTIQFLAAVLDAGLIVGFFYKIFLRRENYRLSLFRRIFSIKHVAIIFVAIFGILPWLLALKLQLMLTNPNSLEFLPTTWIRRIDLTNNTSQIGEVPDGYIIHYLFDSLAAEESRAKALLNFGRPMNFEGRDLRFAVLNGVNLIRANMKGCRLDSVSMMNSHLEHAILEDAHLIGANLMRTHLEKANLFQANLSCAYFSEAHLEEANLVEAHLEGAYFNNAHLEGANLFHAHSEGAIFSAAHLEGAHLNSIHCEGANFHSAHLEGANLRNAHFEASGFVNTEIEGANLRKTNLEGAMITKSNFSGAKIEEASFACSMIDSTDFSNAALTKVNWEKTTNWDSILTKKILISNKSTQENYEKMILHAKERCALNGGCQIDLQGLSTDSRLELLPSIACKGKYIAFGILNQLITEVNSRNFVIDSMCSLCKPIILDVQKEWNYLVEDAACLKK